MATILQYALYVLVLVTVLSALVAAHELGHYLFARLFGMGAEEFAIGMGKPRVAIWFRKTYTVPLPADTPYREGEMVQSISEAMGLEGGAKAVTSEVVRTHKGLALAETTEFTFRPWPVGGFVRIKGMMPEDDGSEIKIPGGFYSKPPWQRFLVLLAGPAFSVLAGLVLLTGVFSTHGVGRADPAAILGGVAKDQPAWNAGLRPDDRIVSLDGKPVERFFQVMQVVREHPGKEFTLEYERKGVRKSTKVVPVADTEPTPVLDENMELTMEKKIQGKLGVQPTVAIVPLSIGQAWKEACQAPVKTVAGLWMTFTRPSLAKDNLGGPGTIVVATAQAVDGGIANVLYFAGVLSISVGIFNLLPIFPLDGGQMTVAIAEMLRGGRRLSIRVQNLVGTIGFALVMALFACVLLIDANRFLAPKPNAGKKIEMEYSDKMKE
ncbi:RIP metalloprotease RseP [soil metagenome]